MKLNPSTIVTSVRKCGRRKEYGLYMVGSGNLSPDGVLFLFNEIHPPIPYQVSVHRGPRIVSAHALLSRTPMAEWWVGSSLKTEIKKSGDAWWIETFGMTRYQRLNIGVCAGATDAEEALTELVNAIAWSPNLVGYFRVLTTTHIHELPRTAIPYNDVHEAIRNFADDQALGYLLKAQAAVWRLADALPPRKRDEHIPSLMRMLAGMNLPQDTIAMRNKYMGQS